MTFEPNVYVVDDNEEMRESLRWLLGSVGTLVEAFASADEFLRRVDPSQPACLILDIRMPGTSGLELQRELNRRSGRLHIIFLTGHADVSTAVRAMREGAVDFFEKPVDEQLLLERVQQVVRQLDQEREQTNELAGFQTALKLLSPREREVLELVVQGARSKQIAKELELSPRTVEVHRSKIMSKTGAGTLARLVSLYRSLPPED